MTATMRASSYLLGLIGLLAACQPTTAPTATAESLAIDSPNGTWSAQFALSETGQLSYQLRRTDTDATLIAPSTLGFTEATLGEITKDLEITATRT